MMKVISTNIADIQTIEFKGEKVKTGIYKYSNPEGIFLGKEAVKDDNVVDTRFHGGKDKACYLYATNHYSYWQNLYPDLNFEWGIFGENISIENLNEKDIFIGDIYQLGEAKVQISQPRIPCYKLGVRFGTQEIVRQFLEADFTGIYLRILEEGKVKPGDEMVLLESPEKILTILQYYRTLCDKTPNEEWQKLALASKFVREDKKKEILKQMRRVF